MRADADAFEAFVPDAVEVVGHDVEEVDVLFHA